MSRKSTIWQFSDSIQLFCVTWYIVVAYQYCCRQWHDVAPAMIGSKGGSVLPGTMAPSHALIAMILALSGAEAQQRSVINCNMKFSQVPPGKVSGYFRDMPISSVGIDFQHLSTIFWDSTLATGALSQGSSFGQTSQAFVAPRVPVKDVASRRTWASTSTAQQSRASAFTWSSLASCAGHLMRVASNCLLLAFFLAL